MLEYEFQWNCVKSLKKRIMTQFLHPLSVFSYFNSCPVPLRQLASPVCREGVIPIALSMSAYRKAEKREQEGGFLQAQHLYSGYFTVMTRIVTRSGTT